MPQPYARLVSWQLFPEDVDLTGRKAQLLDPMIKLWSDVGELCFHFILQPFSYGD